MLKQLAATAIYNYTCCTSFFYYGNIVQFLFRLQLSRNQQGYYLNYQLVC